MDADEITNEKIRTHDLPLEINNVTSKQNLKTLLPKNIIRILKVCSNKQMMRSIEVKLEYGSTAIVVLNLYTLFFSTVFENNEKMKKKQNS